MRALTLLLAIALAALAAVPAAAGPVTCAGRDLIAGLPPAERAALDAATAAAPYPAGNRWRATRDDSTIEIVGTFHIFDARMPARVARLLPAIRAADAVYLEATEKEIAELQRAMAERPELIATSGPTLPERLTAPEWQTLSAAMEARGIPAFMVSKFQPWYVSVMLSIPPCAMAAMAGGSTGLDRLINEAAKAEGTEVRALEPYDTIFRIFGAIPPEEQLDMIRAALPTAGQAEDLFATMTASYFREDHRQIWEFGRLAALAAAPGQAAKLEEDFRVMEEILITNRNRAWLTRIEAAAPGRRLVVAVGAGHLGGDSGLLNLLARAGYRLERQAF